MRDILSAEQTPIQVSQLVHHQVRPKAAEHSDTLCVVLRTNSKRS